MKKRNKKYRPKGAGLPILFGINSDDKRTLKLVPHQELAKLREGRGDEFSFNTLACRINWASVLACNIDFEQDLRPPMREALDALRSLEARYQDKGKYIATGDELRAIGEGLLLADDIQDVTTRRDHRDAFVTVMAVAT